MGRRTGVGVRSVDVEVCPPTAGALFAYGLTEPGLAPLYALLDGGRCAITLPEEAAPLTVAWLVRAWGRAAIHRRMVGPGADRPAHVHYSKAGVR